MMHLQVTRAQNERSAVILAILGHAGSAGRQRRRYRTITKRKEREGAWVADYCHFDVVHPFLCFLFFTCSNEGRGHPRDEVRQVRRRKATPKRKGPLQPARYQTS